MSERQLPTIEQLEPAAREYCRLCDIDADHSSQEVPRPYWRNIAVRLRYELATRWALDVYERTQEKQP